MSRWPFRYHFLQRDDLERELFTLCVRLLHSRPTSEPDGAGPSTGNAEARSGAGRSAARRRYVALRDCADCDFPSLLDAEKRVRALIGTLNETATLLDGFALSERSPRRGGRHSPS